MAKAWYKHPVAIAAGVLGGLFLLAKRAQAMEEARWVEVTTPTSAAPLLPTGHVRFSAPHGMMPDPIEVALVGLPLNAPKVFVGDDRAPSDWPHNDRQGNRNRVDAVNMGPAVPLPGARVWVYS
jgi:hypothetical protein